MEDDGNLVPIADQQMRPQDVQLVTNYLDSLDCSTTQISGKGSSLGNG